MPVLTRPPSRKPNCPWSLVPFRFSLTRGSSRVPRTDAVVLARRLACTWRMSKREAGSSADLRRAHGGTGRPLGPTVAGSDSLALRRLPIQCAHLSPRPMRVEREELAASSPDAPWRARRGGRRGKWRHELRDARVVLPCLRIDEPCVHGAR
jgi:hypothetical protein